MARWTAGFLVSALGLLLAFSVPAARGVDTATFDYAMKDNTQPGGPAYDFVDISGNGTAVPGLSCDDCVSGAIPLEGNPDLEPFKFIFYSTVNPNDPGDSSFAAVFTQAFVSSNGFLTFSAGQPDGCCEGGIIPTPGATPHTIVAGYWADLNPSAAGSVKYRTIGTPPSPRAFVVQFTGVPHFDPDDKNDKLATFQIKLIEGTSDIEVHFQSVTSDGSVQQVGIMDPTGQLGLSYAYGSFSASSRAVRFSYLKPVSALDLAGTLGQQAWYRTDVTASIACSPGSPVGCAQFSYHVDSGAPTTVTQPTSFVVGAEGARTVTWSAVATTGTVELPRSVTVHIDKTKPSVSAGAACTTTEVAGFCTGPVAVTTSASDAGSGLRLGSPSCKLDGRGTACGAISVGSGGAHTLEVTATDLAGNVATKSATFHIDDAPPDVGATAACDLPGEQGWCRGKATVTTTAVDAVSGLAPGSPSCALDGAPVACGAIPVAGDGLREVEVAATDLVGHAATFALQVPVDATPPAATLAAGCAKPGNAGWCRGPVTVAETVSDLTSGMAGKACTLDGATIACGFTISDDGVHTVVLKASDVAGNEATVTMVVKIDSVAPSVRITPDCGKPGTPGWCRSPAYDYLGKATDGGSGLAPGSPACLLDGQPGPCTGFVAGEGPHLLVLDAVDVAGNPAQAALDLAIDSVPPSVVPAPLCSVPGNAGWCRGPVTLAAVASDATSGVDSVTCSVDGATQACPGPYALDGAHVLTVAARDVAGNRATASAPLLIDTLPPVLDAHDECSLPGTDGWCRGKVLVVMTAADLTSGLASLQCKVDGQPHDCGYANVDADGPHTYEVVAEDVAGNVAATVRAFRIDRTAPAGSLFAPPAATPTFEVTWTAADAAFGLARVEVQERRILTPAAEDTQTVCTFLPAGPSASGSCPRTLAPGAYCYRILVTDVAGNTFHSSLQEPVDLAGAAPATTATCTVVV